MHLASSPHPTMHGMTGIIFRQFQLQVLVGGAGLVHPVLVWMKSIPKAVTYSRNMQTRIMRLLSREKYMLEWSQMSIRVKVERRGGSLEELSPSSLDNRPPDISTGLAAHHGANEDRWNQATTTKVFQPHDKQ